MATDTEQAKTLDLNDLLLDGSNDILSEYMRVSFMTTGEGPRVTVSTTDENPVVYSSVIYGSKATDFSEILADYEQSIDGS